MDLVVVNASLEGPGLPADANAVAVSDGRIAAVGPSPDVLRAARAAELIDAGGASVFPGFQDAHAHPSHAGVELGRCHLHHIDDRGALVDAVADYAARHQGEPWIIGSGWGMDAFPGGIATAAELDAVVADRPAFLMNRDGHGAWVNTVALEMAGIDAATPDPFDGRIERDHAGRPVGTLHEGAVDLVERLIPAVTGAEIEAGILRAQAYLFSLGVTAWQDAWVEPADHDAYLAVAGRGDLLAAVTGALWWDRSRGLDQVDELAARRATRGRYAARTVKIMIDGVCENFTAAVLDPYVRRPEPADHPTGLTFVKEPVLGDAVSALDRLGFQVHFHALGDRAVRMALDALAAACEANGESTGRHHLAHLQLVDPADVPRFAALGAVANIQPLWAHEDGYQRDLTVPFLGPERSARQYPFGDLRRAGARLAIGSDWSVSTPNPFEILHVAVTRTHPAEPDVPPLGPDQALSWDDAIEAATLGAAYVCHRDTTSGTIEVGKDADLVVADRNIRIDDEVEMTAGTRARLRSRGARRAEPRSGLPCPTFEYATPARRPAYSVLGSSRRAGIGIQPLPPWRESLSSVVEEIQAGMTLG